MNTVTDRQLENTITRTELGGIIHTYTGYLLSRIHVKYYTNY
jgi:hypothetical protein